jgi:uncharacterized protein (DUF2384 family)
MRPTKRSGTLVRAVAENAPNGTVDFSTAWLELIIRAVDILESKQAIRSWFNDTIPALGGRPVELCQTARGRQAVLRELERMKHGVHS